GDGGDGDNEGEFVERTLVVVRHGEDGAVAVADDGDLGRAVEQLRVRLADEESAEGVGLRGYGEGCGCSADGDAHARVSFLSWMRSKSGVRGAARSSAQSRGFCA